MKKSIFAILALVTLSQTHLNYSMEKEPAVKPLSVQDLINQQDESLTVEDGWLQLQDLDITDLTGLQTIPNPQEVLHLDLSGNNIIELPEHVLDKLVNLQTLILTGNPIVEVKKNTFNKLTKLDQLHLENTGLSSLPDEVFDELSNLKMLNLIGCNLKKVQLRLLQRLSNLDEIGLMQNKLKSIPNNFFNYNPNITKIWLSDNNLKTLPPTIFKFNKKLAQVGLSRNKNLKLPDTLIETIKERNIRLDDIALLGEIKDHTVGQLISELKKEEKLFEILEDDDEDPTLKILNLSQRGITSLEGLETIENPDKILEIDLSDNYITVIPQNILNTFTSLEKLILQGNQLQTIPDKLTLPKLLELDLSQNKIRQLPPNAFSGYPQLEVISLCENKISSIDKGTFKRLFKLKELTLCHNKLTVLPAGLFNDNKNLIVLELNDNLLQFIPANLFSQLVKLEELVLDGNNLGIKKKFKFPPKTEVSFYPQSPSSLRLLAAKKVAEQIKNYNMLETVKHILPLPAQLRNLLLKIAPNQTQKKIVRAIEVIEIYYRAQRTDLNTLIYKFVNFNPGMQKAIQTLIAQKGTREVQQAATQQQVEQILGTGETKIKIEKAIKIANVIKKITKAKAPQQVKKILNEQLNLEEIEILKTVTKNYFNKTYKKISHIK